jgi:uncharacterized membrane protein
MNNMGEWIALIGFMLMVTPSIVMALDGVQEDDDFIQWMMGKSIDQLYFIQACSMTGFCLLWIGIALIALADFQGVAQFV